MFVLEKTHNNNIIVYNKTIDYSADLWLELYRMANSDATISCYYLSYYMIYIVQVYRT